MGGDRMEIPPKVFHELPDRMVDVSHQCVA